MNIDTQARGFVLTQALRSAVSREAQAVFMGLTGAVHLQVRLFDVNGPRGGADKGCLITAHLGRSRRVLVASALDEDLYCAIPQAFEKLRRAVSSTSSRDRTQRRRARAHGQTYPGLGT
jgi:putative sigma-54 modulation protein